MTCTPCYRRHIVVDCAPETGIDAILFACAEDVDLVTGADASGDCSDIIVTSVTTPNSGTDPSMAFHSIATQNSGDVKDVFTFSKVENTDGTKTNTRTLTITIQGDSPGLRCALNQLFGSPHDIILQYPGEAYPYEYLEGMKLINQAFTTDTRSWTLIFELIDSTNTRKLIWDTDFATTQAMIDAATEA